LLPCRRSRAILVAQCPRDAEPRRPDSICARARGIAQFPWTSLQKARLSRWIRNRFNWNPVRVSSMRNPIPIRSLNVRHPADVEMIRARGGAVWRLLGVAGITTASPGTQASNSHGLQPDRVIDNSGRLEDLYYFIDQALSGNRTPKSAPLRNGILIPALPRSKITSSLIMRRLSKSAQIQGAD